MKLEDFKNGSKKDKSAEKDMLEYNIPHSDKTHEKHESRTDSLRIIKKVDPDLFNRIQYWN